MPQLVSGAPVNKDEMSAKHPQIEHDVQSEQDVRLDEPPLYKVLLLNDDYSTMDFVVEVLKYVFHKSEEDANRIMLNVHREGGGRLRIVSVWNRRNEGRDRRRPRP